MEGRKFDAYPVAPESTEVPGGTENVGNTTVSAEGSGQAAATAGNADAAQETGSVESPYGRAFDILRSYMSALNEETDEERKKRERREKRQKTLAGIADALGSFHRAYSYGRGVQPMDLPQSVSAKTQERIDKAKALREKQREQMLNYAIKMGKLKDSERKWQAERADAQQKQDNWVKEFDFRLSEADRAQDRWQKTYDAEQGQRGIDNEFRQEQLGENRRQFNEQFKETRRHNKVTENIAANRGGGYKTYEFDGRNYDSEQARNSAILEEAKRLNIPITTQLKTTSRRGTTTREAVRSIYDIWSDIRAIRGQTGPVQHSQQGGGGTATNNWASGLSLR